ncbi:hypothetical protein MACK_003018 [Theileria orientalis]|uniref:SAC3/GANP/THP3 conserved domain-containing protein n=1 Tax=Theileria orientalis TaxID=68886 RepID=A0A976MEC2_THEOR|nr:hypothetical protein MACK_003018 [Theileria orientalis]
MPMDNNPLMDIFLNYQDVQSFLSKDNKNSTVGKLHGMCSRVEMEEKCRYRTASLFERISTTKLHVRLALKAHVPLAEGAEPDQDKIRPVIWCRRTVYNILYYFVDSDIVKKPYLIDFRFSYADIYFFLEDKLKSIVSDLEVQSCTTHRGHIESLEIITRFLIYSNELLLESPDHSPASSFKFLKRCMSLLVKSYNDVSDIIYKERTTTKLFQRPNLDPTYLLVKDVLVYQSPYEEEFWSYNLLLMIPHFLGNKSMTVTKLSNYVPKKFRKSEMVHVSLEACLAASLLDTEWYFDILRSDRCKPLQAALLNYVGIHLRIKYLYELMVTNSINDIDPSNIDALKSTLGFTEMLDNNFERFLSRYKIRIDRRKGELIYRSADIRQLAHDNKRILNIGGFNGSTSEEVVKKLSKYDSRQIIFDPDYKSPTVSETKSSHCLITSYRYIKPTNSQFLRSYLTSTDAFVHIDEKFNLKMDYSMDNADEISDTVSDIEIIDADDITTHTTSDNTQPTEDIARENVVDDNSHTPINTTNTTQDNTQINADDITTHTTSDNTQSTEDIANEAIVDNNSQTSESTTDLMNDIEMVEVENDIETIEDFVRVRAEDDKTHIILKVSLFGNTQVVITRATTRPFCNTVVLTVPTDYARRIVMAVDSRFLLHDKLVVFGPTGELRNLLVQILPSDVLQLVYYEEPLYYYTYHSQQYSQATETPSSQEYSESHSATALAVYTELFEEEDSVETSEDVSAPVMEEDSVETSEDVSAPVMEEDSVETSEDVSAPVMEEDSVETSEDVSAPVMEEDSVETSEDVSAPVMEEDSVETSEDVSAPVMEEDSVETSEDVSAPVMEEDGEMEPFQQNESVIANTDNPDSVYQSPPVVIDNDAMDSDEQSPSVISNTVDTSAVDHIPSVVPDNDKMDPVQQNSTIVIDNDAMDSDEQSPSVISNTVDTSAVDHIPSVVPDNDKMDPVQQNSTIVIDNDAMDSDEQSPSVISNTVDTSAVDHIPSVVPDNDKMDPVQQNSTIVIDNDAMDSDEQSPSVISNTVDTSAVDHIPSVVPDNDKMDPVQQNSTIVIDNDAMDSDEQSPSVISNTVDTSAVDHIPSVVPDNDKMDPVQQSPPVVIDNDAMDSDEQSPSVISNTVDTSAVDHIPSVVPDNDKMDPVQQNSTIVIDNDAMDSDEQSPSVISNTVDTSAVDHIPSVVPDNDKMDPVQQNSTIVIDNDAMDSDEQSPSVISNTVDTSAVDHIPSVVPDNDKMDPVQQNSTIVIDNDAMDSDEQSPSVISNTVDTSAVDHIPSVVPDNDKMDPVQQNSTKVAEDGDMINVRSPDSSKVPFLSQSSVEDHAPGIQTSHKSHGVESRPVGRETRPSPELVHCSKHHSRREKRRISELESEIHNEEPSAQRNTVEKRNTALHIEDVTPLVEEVTPIVEEVITVVDEVRPLVEEVTPLVEEVTEEGNDIVMAEPDDICLKYHDLYDIAYNAGLAAVSYFHNDQQCNVNVIVARAVEEISKQMMNVVSQYVQYLASLSSNAIQNAREPIQVPSDLTSQAPRNAMAGSLADAESESIGDTEEANVPEYRLEPDARSRSDRDEYFSTKSDDSDEEDVLGEKQKSESVESISEDEYFSQPEGEMEIDEKVQKKRSTSGLPGNDLKRILTAEKYRKRRIQYANLLHNSRWSSTLNDGKEGVVPDHTAAFSDPKSESPIGKIEVPNDPSFDVKDVVDDVPDMLLKLERDITNKEKIETCKFISELMMDNSITTLRRGRREISYKQPYGQLDLSKSSNDPFLEDEIKRSSKQRRLVDDNDSSFNGSKGGHLLEFTVFSGNNDQALDNSINPFIHPDYRQGPYDQSNVDQQNECVARFRRRYNIRRKPLRPPTVPEYVEPSEVDETVQVMDLGSLTFAEFFKFTMPVETSSDDSDDSGGGPSTPGDETPRECSDLEESSSSEERILDSEKPSADKGSLSGPGESRENLEGKEEQKSQESKKEKKKKRNRNILTEYFKNMEVVPSHVNRFIYLDLSTSYLSLESALLQFLKSQTPHVLLKELFLCSICTESVSIINRTTSILPKLKMKSLPLRTSCKSVKRFISPGSPLKQLRQPNTKFTDFLDLARNKMTMALSTLKMLTFYTMNKLRHVRVRNMPKKIFKGLSPFNSILSTTYNSMETVIKTSRKGINNYTGKKFECIDVWGSEIFVHVAFFDFRKNDINKMLWKKMGIDLPELTEKIDQYMSSEYCIHLMMDILAMCGISVNKGELKGKPEHMGVSMFQVMKCQIPLLRSDGKKDSVKLSFNISLRHNRYYRKSPLENKKYFQMVIASNQAPTLISDQVTSSAVGNVTRGSGNVGGITNATVYENSAKTDKTNMFLPMPSNDLYEEMEKNMNINGDLRPHSITWINSLHERLPTISLYPMSRTLRLPSENLFCGKEPDERMYRDDYLPVVDSLWILSYLLNKRGPFDLPTSIPPCIVCYRLSISRMDMLRVFRTTRNVRTPCTCSNEMSDRIELVLTSLSRSLMASLITSGNSFRIPDLEQMIKSSVSFVCVGFELEEPIKNPLPRSVKEGQPPVRDVQVIRLLYEYEFRRKFDNFYKEQMRAGKIRILHKPVKMPDLRMILLEYLIHNGVTPAEMKTNPQGILSNALDKFISKATVDCPEEMWEMYRSDYEYPLIGKNGAYIEGTHKGMVGLKYSKTSFLTIMNIIKDYVRQTTAKMNIDPKTEMEIINKKIDVNYRIKLAREEYGNYIVKLLQCLKYEKMIVPHGMAMYLIDLNNYV